MKIFFNKRKQALQQITIHVHTAQDTQKLEWYNSSSL
jgi:hypothetical protein